MVDGRWKMMGYDIEKGVFISVSVTLTVGLVTAKYPDGVDVGVGLFFDGHIYERKEMKRIESS